MAETAHFRRSSRLAVAIPIRVSGHDEIGESFDVKAQTVEVSRNGAKITTTHPLAPRAEITISNPASGRSCPAKVIWASPTTRPLRNGFVTGVEVTEPADPEAIWAIESPPADWLEAPPPPTADQRLEYLCQRARSVETPAASAQVSGDTFTLSDVSAELATDPNGDELRVETELVPAIHSQVSAESGAAPEVEAPKSKVATKPARPAPGDKANLTLLGLNAGRMASSAVAASQVASAPEKPSATPETESQPGNGAGSAPPSSAQPADDEVGTNGEAGEAPVPAIEEPLQSARVLADTHSDRIEETLREVQQKVSSEAGGQPPEVRGRPTAAPGRQAASASQPPAADVRNSAQEVVNQVREQLAHMTYKSLEILTQKAQAATEESRKQLAKVLEQTVAKSTDTASKSIRRATEQAAANLQASQQQFDAGFEARVGEYEQRFAALSASAAEGLAQQSDALVATFQGRLDSALEEFEYQAGKRLQELVDRLTAQFEVNWGQQAEKQAVAMAGQLSERLRIAGSAVVDEAKNELGAVTKASLEAVTSATANECHSQLDRIFREQSETVSGAADAALASLKLAAEQGQTQLRVVRQEMGGSFEASAQESERRLGEQTARGMEAVERKSASLVEGFESRLGKTLHTFELKASAELSEVLRKTAATRREELARELDSHAAEAGRKLKEGLTASGESVVDEARRLAGVTRDALESLSQTAAEDCRRKLDEFRSKSLSVQKQIDALNQNSAERIQNEIRPPKPQSSRRRLVITLVVLLLCLVPAVGAIYLSTRPVMRLRPESPLGFADVNPKWNAKRSAAEEQLASAYWDAAVENVQTMYHYHESLPVDPPVAFQVDPRMFASSGVKIDFAASRVRYWQKLREAWGQPQTWVPSDGLNTDWINNLFAPARGGGAQPKLDSSAPPAPQAPANTNP